MPSFRRPELGFLLARLRKALQDGFLELRGFFFGKERNLRIAIASSLTLHFLMIFALGGAESTGKKAGEVYASRIPRSVELQLSPLIRENVQPLTEVLPIPEPTREPDPIPMNQSEKSDHPSAEETSQGDKQLLVGPLSEMQYLPPRQLNRRPIVQSPVETDCPHPERYPDGGAIFLVLWVSEFGVVDSVTVDKADLPSSCVNAVIEQYKLARFSPAEKDGRHVKARLRIVVEYPPLIPIRK